jgi:hypothetical protein
MRFFADQKATTRICPCVIVPVLSKMTVVMLAAFSIASALRTKMPFCANRPKATAIAVGVAKPIAQGQAMTVTDTAATNALATSPATMNQPKKVAAASKRTMGTNTAATLSARRCIAGLVACASSINRAI